MNEKTLYPQAAVLREHGRMPLFFAACILETVALLLSVITLFVSGIPSLASEVSVMFVASTTFIKVLVYTTVGIFLSFSLLGVAGLWLIRFSARSDKPLRPLGFTLMAASLFADTIATGLFVMLYIIVCFLDFSFITLISAGVSIYIFIITLREIRFAFSVREIAMQGYTTGYRGDTLRIPLLVILVINVISQVIQTIRSFGPMLNVSIGTAFLDLGLTAAEIASSICLYIVVSSLIRSLPRFAGEKPYTDPQQLAP